MDKKIIKDKVAFTQETKGYTITATYLKEPETDALIEIKKVGKVVKEFLFPAYKIWNIAAHMNDIIAGFEKGNDDGLYEAGSDGLGGNVYQGEKR
jgi:hypothetical protein